MGQWNPDAYLRFEQERTLPSRDLAARIDLANPRTIVDIGCGPGNSTSVLGNAWPDAHVAGLDNSPEMIRKAQAAYPRYEWILADASAWQTSATFDLVFSNATLQWIPEHTRVLGGLFDRVNPGGALAVQVPYNLDSPLYKALVSVSKNGRWHDMMRGCSDQILYADENHYYEILSPLSKRLEMWRTTYIHIMESHQSLIDWYSSTGMRMYLDRLDTEEKRRAFTDEILETCREQYPFQRDGKILFPFQRLFFVACKG
jgi:trans-aconitate 2-methyltransferase